MVEIRDLQRWLDATALAWARRHPDAAAALFSDDASYHEDPFDEPIRGRAAIRHYCAMGKPVLGARFSTTLHHRPITMSRGRDLIW